METPTSQDMKDIFNRIEAYKISVGESHYDYAKPIISAPMTPLARALDARIIASNELYLAIANGRNIEIHPLFELKPFLRYDGVLREGQGYEEILAAGNKVNIQYKRDGTAVADVYEQRKEQQMTVFDAADRGIG